MTDHLPDANLSIGPMSWCNYCQQNVGGAIKHKAGCKTLTNAELLALKLAHPERYGIDGPVVVTKPINILDAPVSTERLEQLAKMIECSATLGIEATNPGAQQQLEIASALRELMALREQCEWHPIETAPKDGTKIDMWVVDIKGDSFRQTDVFWSEKHGEWFADDWGGSGEPGSFEIRKGEWKHDLSFARAATHWMPLPMPPSSSSATHPNLKGNSVL